jgi:hypothetical protein
MERKSIVEKSAITREIGAIHRFIKKPIGGSDHRNIGSTGIGSLIHWKTEFTTEARRRGEKPLTAKDAKETAQRMQRALTPN